MIFHLPLTRWQPYYAILGGILIAASLYFLFTKGLNFETDFKGGLKIQLQFSQAITERELRDTLSQVPNMGNFSLQRLGEVQENRFIIKTDLPESTAAETPSLSTRITQTLEGKRGSDSVILEKEESVGPKAGKELRRKGQLAVLISWLLILIYIGWRFDFYFAPGAIIALIHDVTITLGALALWQIPFSLTSVAALLTIIGYSINDTIIVYDRIRENLTKGLQVSLSEIINQSLNEVLSRTVITSLTVFFVVVVLFIIAEGDIQNFAFAMIVGVIFGTLSSIFVATPIFQLLKKLFPGQGGGKGH